MSIKGHGSKAGLTHMEGRPKQSSIGYHGNSPNTPYIINYSRNSVQVHRGQGIIRRLLGR